MQSKPTDPALGAVEAAEAAGTSSLAGGGEADAESNGAAVFAEVARDITGHGQVNGTRAHASTGTSNGGSANGGSANGGSAGGATDAPESDPVSSEAQR